MQIIFSKSGCLLCGLVLSSMYNYAIAQAKADDLLGVWLTESQKAHIKIEKINNQYHGKIIWLRDPNNALGKPKVDANNPDAKLKTRPIIGLKLLRNFTWDGSEWEDGKIYDPDSGSDYSCVIHLVNANTIKVRGYIGISLIGKTQIWTRVK